MSNIKQIGLFTAEFENRLPELIAESMKRSLNLFGNMATTKYMIPTGTGGQSSRPGAKSPVDPERLTWRTGNLMRSLTRSGSRGFFETSISQEGSVWSIEKGTTLPYAAIHEKGGSIDAHAMQITERMRKFFWAKWYESGEEDEMWKRSALKRGPIEIPERLMRARPFATPTLRDEEFDKGTANIFRANIGQELADTARRYLEFS